MLLSERLARLEVDLVLAIGREPTAELIGEARRLERLVRRYQARDLVAGKLEPDFAVDQSWGP